MSKERDWKVTGWTPDWTTFGLSGQGTYRVEHTETDTTKEVSASSKKELGERIAKGKFNE